MSIEIPKWIYSFAHYHYLREGIAKRAFYEYETSGPNLIHRVRRHNRLYAEYRLIHRGERPGAWYSADKEEDLRDGLRQVRNGFTDLDIDVLDILLAHWLKTRRRQEQFIEIDTDKILYSRGLNHKVNGQRSNADAIGRGYTPRQREVVNRAICRLLLLWGDVKVIHSHDAKTFRQESRLLSLPESPRTPGYFQKENPTKRLLSDSENTLGKRHSFRFRPGKVLRRYNLFQRMYQPGALYSYNYRQNAWEKRLGRYLCWQHRIRQDEGSRSMLKTTSSLLNSIVINAERNRYQLREDKDETSIKPEYRTEGVGAPSYRVRERLNKALNQLEDDGIVESWKYEQGWDPSWSRKTNWADLWLKSSIRIEMGSAINAAYEDSAPPPNGNDADSPQNGQNASSALKIILRKTDLNQSDVAEKVGISQGYVSAIKTRRKIPSAEVSADIKRLLDRHTNDITGPVY